MRACAEQALRNMMDMYIYFLFMYVSQSNLVLPVSLSGLITPGKSESPNELPALACKAYCIRLLLLKLRVCASS